MVTVEGGEATTAAQLRKLTVKSNYPLAVVNIQATAGDGTVTNLEKILFNGQSEKGVPRKYALEDSEALRGDVSGYTEISVEVVTSTGKRFTHVTVKAN